MAPQCPFDLGLTCPCACLPVLSHQHTQSFPRLVVLSSWERKTLRLHWAPIPFLSPSPAQIHIGSEQNLATTLLWVNRSIIFIIPSTAATECCCENMTPLLETFQRLTSSLLCPLTALRPPPCSWLPLLQQLCPVLVAPQTLLGGISPRWSCSFYPSSYEAHSLLSFILKSCVLSEAFPIANSNSAPCPGRPCLSPLLDFSAQTYDPWTRSALYLCNDVVHKPSPESSSVRVGSCLATKVSLTPDM